MPGSDQKIIHVAVAVIKNDSEQVLLALRPDHVHQGGLWEFPGGKVEVGESVEQALKREIFEETGIEINYVEPLIRVKHKYTDKSVLLDVWSVYEYTKEACGKEGQQIEWVDIDELSIENMPAADLPIINAIRLPDSCLITPETNEDPAVFLQELKQSLQAGIKLVQFRAGNLIEADYINMARQVVSLSHQYNAKVIINQSNNVFEQCFADGLHLNSERLMGLQTRPVSDNILLSASCHNLEEVQQANKVSMDFIMLSPVLPTQSHPGTRELGWDLFHDLTESACMPVYALGGMDKRYIIKARRYGAQGIAAISALWANK